MTNERKIPPVDYVSSRRHDAKPYSVAAMTGICCAMGALVGTIAVFVHAMHDDNGVIGRKLWYLIAIASAAAVIAGVIAEVQIRRGLRGRFMSIVAIGGGSILCCLSVFFIYADYTGVGLGY